MLKILVYLHSICCRLRDSGKPMCCRSKMLTNVHQNNYSRKQTSIGHIGLLWEELYFLHYIDVIMTTMAFQITSRTVVYSTVYSDADQRKHQSSAPLAFVWGIHRDRWIPRTKASYAENVSIWWRHHAFDFHQFHPGPLEKSSVFIQINKRQCDVILWNFISFNRRYVVMYIDEWCKTFIF